MNKSKKVVLIGAGLGSLSTALRLSHKGYEVKIIEKYHQAGGRLNQLKKDGFTFDVGPSFFSMSYEFRELFKSVGLDNILEYNELNPLYTVYFSNRKEPYIIHKDLEELAKQFPLEENFVLKVQKYLKQAGEIFHDTEYKVIKKNFNNKVAYLLSLATVPLKHAPKLFRSMWTELSKHFDTEELKIVFSLVAFFLGATPYDTPAVYSLLNYTEIQHDGYWNVKGGMYSITERIVEVLKQKGVEFIYNTEIVGVEYDNNKVIGLKDSFGNLHTGDIFVSNADAAAFRGKILNRQKYSEEKLDKLHWTLAPFTIYLGVKGKLENLHHHNYFLGDNFQDYANKIFKTSISPEKPYYYVNASSKSNPDCAPEGCENIFILCPVPDLRYKSNWDDSETLANNIIEDLSERVNFNIKENIITQTIWNPITWRDNFGLYKGSGLGLAHDMNQVGAFRPNNKDEVFNNLYYVGASTIPGTGLPIVVIGSKLVTERIENEHSII
jgi:phytoene desaturase